MKRNIYILIISCLLFSLGIQAQEHLHIGSIFDKYGKAKGATLVQLSREVLSQGNTNIQFYKSLIVPANETLRKDITEALETDIKTSATLSESRKISSDSKTYFESGTYFIGKNKKGEKEYLLFKQKQSNITLVYLRGYFDPDELSSELKELKNLFIYVNDKRIKL